MIISRSVQYLCMKNKFDFSTLKRQCETGKPSRLKRTTKDATEIICEDLRGVLYRSTAWRVGGVVFISILRSAHVLIEFTH